MSYFPYDRQYDTCSNSNKNDKEFELNFLTNCRYVKNQKILSNRKFTSCYSLNNWKIYINVYMRSFACLKGKELL